jgi:hypothetical protein
MRSQAIYGVYMCSAKAKRKDAPSTQSDAVFPNTVIQYRKSQNRKYGYGVLPVSPEILLTHGKDAQRCAMGLLSRQLSSSLRPV